MNIVVCIKQVPDVDDIKWTKENNLDRSNMLTKLNPHDEWALDWVCGIKNKFKDVKITAISMGPNQASEVLSYALAKGADRAILLSDRAFSGSDTLVTAKIIARAIEKYVGDYSLAQMLSIPDVIGVNEIFNADKNMAIVSQKFDSDVNVYEINTPCLLAVKAQAKEQFIPKIEDYIRAQNKGIEIYGLEDLGFDKNEVGIIGSPTMVWRAFRPETNKKAIELLENCIDDVYEMMLKAK